MKIRVPFRMNLELFKQLILTDPRPQRRAARLQLEANLSFCHVWTATYRSEGSTLAFEESVRDPLATKAISTLHAGAGLK